LCIKFNKIITEADVHTATPTMIGNAAATWAGWAVSAVSAKFYRSQSDTRPRPPLTGKNLSKPASLGTFERTARCCFKKKL
jgi:hypothetical protein